MEIHLDNNFIEEFISRYQDQASKAVKYLTILGIHFFQTITKQNLSFDELQSIAKTISKAQSAGNMYIDKELQVIKEEIAQLSKKVENKLGSPTVSQQEKIERTQNIQKKVEENQHLTSMPLKNAGLSMKFDPKALTHKPPSAWREGDKRGAARPANQIENLEGNIENIQERAGSRVSPVSHSAERRDTSLGSSKREYTITPKPNEIKFSHVDLRSSKNNVTRHHLDDTEAKKTLNEEGVIFFPAKERDDIQQNKRETLKEESLAKSPFFGREKPEQVEESYHAEWDDMTGSSPKASYLSKSPRFQQITNESNSQMYSTATIQGNKENYKPPQNRSKIQSKANIPRKSQTKAPVDVIKKKIQPTKSSFSQLGGSKSSNSQDYGYVSSKIKDEVNYHKELSKQYKKLRQSINQSEGYEDELLQSTSTRYEPRREISQDQVSRNIDRPQNRWERQQSNFEDIVKDRTPKLMESTDSALKSSLTMQQLASNNYEEKLSSSNNTRPQDRFDITQRDEEDNFYRSKAENRGGMLDIANSFLNSPLMQHITNIDMKNFDTSFKDSIGYHQPRNPGNYSSGPDFKESIGFMPSQTGNLATEEDMRLQSSHGLQQSKYSNTGNNFYQAYPRRNNSLLGGSTNRRFQENMHNELKSSYNREGIDSLASSNFSNFLNDEMKGFYQKERLDLKKPKNSELIMRFGSSEASSMSFQGNEPPISNIKQEKKSIFHKNEFAENLDNTNNKTFDGISFDNANVFNNERMSVTQILNN